MKTKLIWSRVEHLVHNDNKDKNFILNHMVLKIIIDLLMSQIIYFKISTCCYIILIYFKLNFFLNLSFSYLNKLTFFNLN